MKVIKGIKIGGLQQKVFNLVLLFILLLAAVYASVGIWQRHELTAIVQDTGAQQQKAITEISEQTMEKVLSISMTQTTALQGYIADELFSGVRSNVLTLQAFASELFAHAELFSPHAIAPPSAENDGTAAVMLIHEAAADPAHSEALGLVGNMSEIMLAMYESSDRLGSLFIGTADGNMVLVNDRSASYVAPDGTPLTLEIRQRPWYVQAEAAGELIFTGVELDAYTDIPMLECAAPVYHEGRLVAVVSADVFLGSVGDYIKRSTTEGTFLCIIDDGGRVLFSSAESGVFRAEAPDLRESENRELARFVTKALTEETELALIEIEGKDYYLNAAPMASVNWTVLSGVEKELTEQSTVALLNNYDEINSGALETYRQGARRSVKVLVIETAVVVLLAAAGALILSSRMVKPLEQMTRRINGMGEGDSLFQMEAVYRTGDEIELLAESFSTLSKRAMDYITQITQITAEKERIGTELALATRIQADMLPNMFPPFPERSEFDIYASMDPAKEVGGDFYDFFLIDDDHLCLVMADVSGKGVPAALFMMASKIILANNAMTGKEPARILSDTNAAICSNNREEMFVTVWLGILELSTGRLTAANAGHEYPALKRADGSFELFRDKHGLVIGAMDHAKYRQYEIQLQPGDRLFVYTDGVTEATDAQKVLFGTDRMLAALNREPEAAPDRLLRSVREDIDAFVGDAPQFDDITMLGLCYNGPRSAARELTLDAAVENLDRVIGFLDGELEALDCPLKAQMQLDVALEELFVNVAHYAYAPGTGTVTVRIQPEKDPKRVTVTLIDSGVPYDPLAKADPDVTLSAEDRQIGGLGIFMVKKSVDEISYEYRDGQNVLRFVKNLG